MLTPNHNPLAKETGSKRSFLVLAGVVILVLAAALRIGGALNDLWLDEVWSLKLVSGILSPWQVFTGIHLDNNHYLNGLWLYFMGPHASALLYRVPSIVAGAGSVALAGLIGRRRNTAAAFFAMVLTGFSYALVLYSSEARGYSSAVFFSFLAFYSLALYLERPRWQMAALYSASAVLGLASHLIFASVLLASMAWIVWRLDSIHASRRQITRCLLSCQAAPVLFLAWIYLVDVRQLVEGGGMARHSLIGTYGTALAWALGTPSPDAMQILFCLVAIVIFVAAIRLLRRERTGSFLFFGGVILVFPILLAVVRNAETIYVRYFILGMAFLLILASYGLASLYYRGAAGKWACFLLLGAYLAANGWHIAELFKDGRGHYRDAIHYIAEHSHGPAITIDSDNDFQVPLMLDYYTDAMEGKKVEYRLKKSGPWGAEWLVCQKDSLDDPAPPHGARMAESAGFQYELVETYPTAPLSGLRWYLYQKREK